MNGPIFLWEELTLNQQNAIRERVEHNSLTASQLELSLWRLLSLGWQREAITAEDLASFRTEINQVRPSATVI